MQRRRLPSISLVLVMTATLVATAAGSLQSPDQFVGHKVGADHKLVRWDKIVEYMKLAAANSDRVRFRELGKTSSGNPFRTRPRLYDAWRPRPNSQPRNTGSAWWTDGSYPRPRWMRPDSFCRSPDAPPDSFWRRSDHKPSRR